LLANNNLVSDCGTEIRSCLKACSARGVCLEEGWPMDIKKIDSYPLINQDNVLRKNMTYKRVPTVLKDIINTLGHNYLIIAGISISQQFIDLDESGVVHNYQPKDIVANHCILIVGYSLIRGEFICRNCWGYKWGDDGYCYIPFELVDSKMVKDCWIIDYEETKNYKYDKILVPNQLYDSPITNTDLKIDVNIENKDSNSEISFSPISKVDDSPLSENKSVKTSDIRETEILSNFTTDTVNIENIPN
jgi:hypothetical protein